MMGRSSLVVMAAALLAAATADHAPPHEIIDLDLLPAQRWVPLATKYNDTAARYTPGDGMIGVQFIGYLLWYRFGLCGFTRALLLLAACRG